MLFDSVEKDGGVYWQSHTFKYDLRATLITNAKCEQCGDYYELFVKETGEDTYTSNHTWQQIKCIKCFLRYLEQNLSEIISVTEPICDNGFISFTVLEDNVKGYLDDNDNISEINSDNTSCDIDSTNFEIKSVGDLKHFINYIYNTWITKHSSFD